MHFAVRTALKILVKGKKKKKKKKKKCIVYSISMLIKSLTNFEFL